MTDFEALTELLKVEAEAGSRAVFVDPQMFTYFAQRMSARIEVTPGEGARILVRTAHGPIWLITEDS